MDIVFLPYYAIGLLIVVIGAVIGAFWLHKSSKLGGAIAGAVSAAILMALFKAVVPAKLTTNTSTYNAQQQVEIQSRHSKLPPKVVVEQLTFEEKLKQADEKNETRSNQLKKDLNL